MGLSKTSWEMHYDQMRCPRLIQVNDQQIKDQYSAKPHHKVMNFLFIYNFKNNTYINQF